MNNGDIRWLRWLIQVLICSAIVNQASGVTRSPIIVCFINSTGVHRGNIVKISMSELIYHAIPGTGGNPYSIVYDMLSDRIFWSDSSLNKIIYSDLSGGGKQVLIATGGKKLTAIAIDSVLRWMFYVAGGKIVKMKIEQGTKTTICSNCWNVLSMVTQRSDKKVFYSTPRGIYSTTYDGKNKGMVIGGSSVTRVTSLFNTGVDNILYFVDNKLNRIDKVKTDKTGRMNLATRSRAALFGIFVFEATIYVSDKNLGGFHVLNINGKEKKNFQMANYQPSAFTVFRQKVCGDGLWGRNCENKCGHCMHGMCKKATGTCYGGCDYGYFGGKMHEFFVPLSLCHLSCDGCLTGLIKCDEDEATHCKMKPPFDGFDLNDLKTQIVLGSGALLFLLSCLYCCCNKKRRKKCTKKMCCRT